MIIVMLSTMHCYLPSNKIKQYFKRVLSTVGMRHDRDIMLDDFNFLVNEATRHPGKLLHDVTELFYLLKHVKGPTHQCGRTLDFLFFCLQPVTYPLQTRGLQSAE